MAMSIIQHSAGREMCSTHDTNPRRQQVNVSGLPEVVHAYDGKTYYYILVFFLIQISFEKFGRKKSEFSEKFWKPGFPATSGKNGNKKKPLI